MKKILITGATGFVASHLIPRLLEDGNNEVWGLVRSSEKADELDRRFGIGSEIADITDPEALLRVRRDYDIVYHLAAMGHVSSISEDAFRDFVRVNVTGTDNLIQHFRSGGGIQRFIHFSSTAAMGPATAPILNENSAMDPATPYQKSKRQSELTSLGYYEREGFPTVLIRPCMIYGVGGYGEFYKFCRLMKKGVFPKVGRGENLTPLIHVEDVVQAAANAAVYGRAGEAYILASGRSLPLDELRGYVVDAIGQRPPYPYVPAGLALGLARVYEGVCQRFGAEPIVTYRNIKSTVDDRTFDISKAKEGLRFQPKIPFKEGIAETVAWYRETGKL